MSLRKCDGIRSWVLGAAATGLLLPALPVFGQSKTSFPLPKSNASKQTSAAAPKAGKQQPAVLLTDATNNASPIVPTSGEKSEVQKQVEALYQADGREMPAFNMQPLQPLQPLNSGNPPAGSPVPQNGRPAPAAQVAPVRPTQGYKQYQPKPQAMPYVQQAPTPQTRNYATAIDPKAQTVNTASATQSAQPASRNPISKFIRRVTGANRAPVQAPIPPEDLVTAPVNSVPASAAPAPLPVAPADLSYSSQPVPVQPVVQAAPEATMPLLSSTPTLPVVNPNPSRPAVEEDPFAPTELAQPDSSLPVLAGAPTPLTPKSAAVGLPPLMSDPQPQQRPVASKKTPQPPAESRELMGDFPDPFTEVAESEADRGRVARTSPEPKSKVAETPPAVTVTESLATPAEQEPVATADENPFAVEAKDFTEPRLDESVAVQLVEEPPVPTRPVHPLERDDEQPPVSAMVPNASTPTANAPMVSVPNVNMPNVGAPMTPQVEAPPAELSRVEEQRSDENALAPAPPAEMPAQSAVALPQSEPRATTTPDTTPDPSLEKMRRIRERFGMKGLKGFCPVTLHDERDLVDARPEFSFTYRSQKFHFATAEARDKFEADPGKYAPAAYGADVVALSRDKDVVEGTLDFAAWYKGRLYLFGTQANYETFVASPAKFATLVANE